MSRELIVDNFAGGGGASTGIELAIGRSVDIAINHDPSAIAMHKVNHPDTLHYCESVWDIDPRKVTNGLPIALAWFSPDCKHFSKAKGGKPVDKNIRGLTWVILRWALDVSPRVIMLENVEEIQGWGPLIIDEDGNEHPDPKRKGETFAGFVAMMTCGIEPGHPALIEACEFLEINPEGEHAKRLINGLGYDGAGKELVAADYGAPTKRKRFFQIFRNDGQPIVWPDSTYGDPNSLKVKAGKLKPWRTAAEIIDWSKPCPSIFERKKPLADNTLRRIARGIQRFVIDNPNPFIAPFIVRVNHSGSSHHYTDSIDEPLKTITAKNGWGIVEPFIARIGQTGFGGDRMQYPLDDPLTTVVSKAEHLLVTPTLMVNNTGHPGSKLDKPVRTITTGNHHALVAAFLTQYHTETSKSEVRGQSIDKPIMTLDTSPRYSLVTSHLLQMNNNCDGRSLEEPMKTIVASPGHWGEVRAFLLKYYGTGEGQKLDEPLATVTTKDRFGLVTIHGQDYQIIDIGMRMLEPRELFDAQGFPHDYVIDTDYYGQKYSKSVQVARCGNAVPPPFAEALVKANLPELCGIKKPKQEQTQMSLF